MRVQLPLLAVLCCAKLCYGQYGTCTNGARYQEKMDGQQGTSGCCRGDENKMTQEDNSNKDVGTNYGVKETTPAQNPRIETRTLRKKNLLPPYLYPVVLR